MESVRIFISEAYAKSMGSSQSIKIDSSSTSSASSSSSSTTLSSSTSTSASCSATTTATAAKKHTKPKSLFKNRENHRLPKLIHRDVTRFYEIPYGPFKCPNDVLKSFSYELLHEIDHGSFGTVYVANDLRKGKKVACKVIEMQQTYQRNTFEENKNELLTIERVKHAYVIKVYCHFVVQGNGFNRMYIFMALADGGNLYKFIKNSNKIISEKQSRLYFAQILCGINHMHSVGIAHRDIKPQNVLLCSNRNSISGDYCLVVTDFGLSKVVTDQQQLAMSICGTQAFMSPELLQMKPYNPFAADVWALGITLFQMLSSMSLPFDFHQPQPLIIQSMMEKKINFPNQNVKSSLNNNNQSNRQQQPLSNEYKQLIRLMLEPNEKQRIKMIDITKHTWIVREYSMAESNSRLLRSSR